ncbi:phosphoenolpyruvate--protein phosphotransferase [Microcella sp.]|uniref:phosphoenolpyruvate--protein phosphotransferase n=1 Tax=Microcella sp. TaxID=1913979 RepID=UPI00299F779A|nr:phosphoenolpyruvate--protein phosphotransferase [Microcella sp.]MDX2026130.1 phosphoenolpyruvate--protein phosphotransferase [Microcella sp.]
MLTLAVTTDWLRRWASEIAENEQHLTRLDAAIGDADHGANLQRGMSAVVAQLDAQPPSTVREALTRAGLTLVSTVGGASGPLFGTLLLRAATACGDASALDGPALVAALRAGAAGVQQRGHAELGDKTLLDALVPAIEALDAAVATGAPLTAAASTAAIAAGVARDATAELVARRGRASYLGDRSRGSIDPGAASAALMLDALAAALAAAASVPTAPISTPTTATEAPTVAPRRTADRRAPRVGLVLVSHSRALAEAAATLAREFTPADPPRIAIAAGRADGGTGTNATRVAAAISEASEGVGVVVLTDLGSAVLSADMALEFIAQRIDVRVVPAPFIEGLLAAVVRAATGDSIDVVAAEASAALAPKVALLAGSATSTDAPGPAASGSAATPSPAAAPDQPSASAIALVRNEGGLHARPAAEIAALAATFSSTISLAVPGKPAAPAASPLSISILIAKPGTEVEVSATGDDATAAVRAIADLIEGGFGEPLVTAPTPTVVPALLADAVEPDRGSGPLGVSSGRVVGPVAVLVHAIAEPSATVIMAPPSRAAAAQIVTDALRATAAQYRERAAATEGHRAEVLAATAAIADDAVLHDAASRAVHERGVSPERAVWDAIARLVADYRAAGGSLLDRVTDLHDVRDRTIAAITGVEPPGLPERREPYILIADDLAPADTVTLDPSQCLALVTEQGGPTSHTAIIARELGLPAVVGVMGATSIADGTLVLVDGDTGEVIVQPDLAEQATATGVITLPPFVGPGKTADGHVVVLSANVGAPREIARAVERGADGVGLFRTEFCFLDRADEPSVAEQVAAYREVFAAFPQQRIIVRTLDAGSDKPLPFLTAIDEPNPVLGLRGVRTAIRDPQVLERQLQAIAEAAAAERADVAVMAPMIATLGETREFAARARAAGIASVGIMLETPAAAVTAAELCTAVDFISVGTNDLSQYTMAADRMSASLAALADPWQPALLRMIRLVGEAAATTGTPMGLCGEAAANPDFAAVLVGLGASSLSMTARAIPTVGARLAGVTLEQCRTAATAACAAAEPVEARAAARAVLA